MLVNAVIQRWAAIPRGPVSPNTHCGLAVDVLFVHDY